MFNNKDENFSLSFTAINKYVLYRNNKLAQYDTLTDEIKKVCANIKLCLTQLKNKNIIHFTKIRLLYKSSIYIIISYIHLLN